MVLAASPSRLLRNERTSSGTMDVIEGSVPRKSSKRRIVVS